MDFSCTVSEMQANFLVSMKNIYPKFKTIFWGQIGQKIDLASLSCLAENTAHQIVREAKNGWGTICNIVNFMAFWPVTSCFC